MTVCYLCGYRINHDIVTHWHPFFGTVDHIFPRALGGKDRRDNTLPTHRMCNQIKGRSLATASIMDQCRQAVEREAGLMSRSLGPRKHDKAKQLQEQAIQATVKGLRDRALRIAEIAGLCFQCGTNVPEGFWCGCGTAPMRFKVEVVR